VYSRGAPHDKTESQTRVGFPPVRRVARRRLRRARRGRRGWSDHEGDRCTGGDVVDVDARLWVRLGLRYRSGRSKDWLKFKTPEAPAVKREAEEDWGR
jgi:hypothetical protein